MREHYHFSLLLLLSAVSAPCGSVLAAGDTDCDSAPTPAPVALESVASLAYGGQGGCWGWRGPDGTDYAIVGTANGVAFFDTRTMTNVAFAPGPLCSARDIKTYKHYCYAVEECDTVGMQIIDMQYLPDSVHVLGVYRTARPSFVPNTDWFRRLSIDTVQGHVFIVRAYAPEVVIADLADPENPVDGQVISLGHQSQVLDLVAHDGLVWISEGDRSTFSVWSIPSVDAVSLVDRIALPEGSGAVTSMALTGDQTRLVTTIGSADGKLIIWDVADPSGAFALSESAVLPPGVRDIGIEGEFVFLSDCDLSLIVIDISSSLCPVEVGRYRRTFGDLEFGCLSIFPHTRTGLLYATDAGGVLHMLETDIPYVGFSAAPLIGEAPLTVSFTSENALGVSGWAWDLGDGDSAFVADPTHIFERGLYTVSVEASNAAGGTDLRVREHFVTALAETTFVMDTAFPANTRGSWEISLSNSVPLTQLILPVRLSGVPEYATLDSVEVAGTRLEQYELQHLLFDNRFNGELVMRYSPNTGGGAAPLPPGSGVVARVHFTLAPDVPEGTDLRLSIAGPVGSDRLTGATWSTAFDIVPDSAVMTVGAAVCACPCHADPECDGVVNVLDVVRLADVAFRNAEAVFDPECIHSARTDVDCNGATDVIDVVTIVAVAFRNADPASSFCEPCN